MVEHTEILNDSVSEQPEVESKSVLETLLAESKSAKVPARTNKSSKKGRFSSVREGLAFIYATFNNTIVAVTDANGNKIASCSSGELGYKGSKKSTPHAAKEVAESAINKALNLSDLQKVAVVVRGAGSGRESALREFGKRFVVSSIKEGTTVAFNGCRPPKERRV